MSDQNKNEPEETPQEKFDRLASDPEDEANKTRTSEPAAQDDTQPIEAGADEETDHPSQASGSEEKDEGQALPSEFVSLAPRVNRRPPEEPRAQTPFSPPRPQLPPLQRPPRSGTSATRPQTTPPPPSLGRTPTNPPPRTGTMGMPMPRRVEQVDPNATRVSPSAYQPPAARPGGRLPSPYQAEDAQPIVRPRSVSGFRRGLGCFLRFAMFAAFAAIILVVIAGSIVMYEYYSIARTLPPVEDLRQRASQFETTRIYDRSGNLLYEILDPNAGRRTYVTLDKISPYLVAATIATEDKEYYSHPGFDALAIVRAFVQNYRGGETISGASTITQQLARMLILEPEEAGQRTYMRKVREALLAAEITRRYSKDEILELYLNEIYYGNMAYGIEAASQTYFNTSAQNLTLAQASFLAGLPQAPSVYDIYSNREVTLGRQTDVLLLMIADSREQGCIYVSNNIDRICVSDADALAAFNLTSSYDFPAPDVQMRYPHWVNLVRAELEALYDPQTIYQEGFSVYTTIDPVLQDTAERLVKEQVALLADKHVTNGALVAIDPATGEILALVGSADFYNESISGQVNMATAPRQPGSSVKPFTYLAAFEMGWTPGTLLWDVPSEFPPSGDPNDPRDPYRPVNYDGNFHGPVTVRSALANSYNIPAVKTLQFVGIYDNPTVAGEDGFIAMARRLGITSLTLPDYGLSLTLGGGEISLLEMTSAYAVLANNGNRVAPVTISKIVDRQGNVVFEYKPPSGQQVVRPEHAFLISSILADNQARAPMFGTNSVLALPFPAAAKTGTTNDYRDNWTLGYTPDLAVGVWIGNADYTPMQSTTGVTGAAPIWASFMQAAVPQVSGGNPTPFSKPAGVIERVICAISGTEPSQWCPEQRSEFFAADQPPLPADQDLWSRVTFDSWTGLRASAACGFEFVKEDYALNVTDPFAIDWIQNNSSGRAWAEDFDLPDPVVYVPQRECAASDPQPDLAFSSLSEGQTLTGNPVVINGRASATADFESFVIEYGLGTDPVEWIRLYESGSQVYQNSQLYEWDASNVPSGTITLRLKMNSTRRTFAEVRIHLNMQVPTPTPTVTPTPTATATPPAPPTVTPTATPQEGNLP